MAFDLGQFKNLGDLKDVWDKLQTKDWNGLIAAIKEVRSEKGDSESLNKAEKKAGQAIAEGKDFPSNPADLAMFLGGRKAGHDEK